MAPQGQAPRWGRVMLHPLRRTRQRGVSRIVAVRGRSMEPTLYDGDLMLVSVGSRPHAGRLAVVRLPGERPLSVKRLAFRTPEGWWVERDNPREGVDSWQLGAVPEADVVALVIARCWPLRRGARLRSDHGE